MFLLVLATQNGHKDIVKLLIENKAKVNDVTATNMSALLKGCRINNIKKKNFKFLYSMCKW